MPHLGVANLAVTLVTTAIACSFATEAAAGQMPISIDGVFADWSGIEPAYEDTVGDGGPAGIDLGRIWIADDDRFLFLRFELGVEVDLSEENDLRLYLDTDADTETGLPVGEIGAELEWRFGERTGTFHREGEYATVFHRHIRFRAAPTVTAPAFEVAFGRDTLPDGQHPLFGGSVVRLVLSDAGGGDRLPDAGEFLTYNLDEGQLLPEAPTPIDRTSPADLRVITHNVHFDSPWDPALAGRFERLVTAVAPDIINFQEIIEHTAAETAALVEDWLPLGLDESWHAAGNHDCKTVSRYPILDSWAIDGNLAVFIDARSILRCELLMVNAHLPYGTNDAARQAEIDRIMGFVRDAQRGVGPVDLSPKTPILITGDLNLVGLARQLTTLITGDIANEVDFGPDFTPDWDGSDIISLVSRQTEKRMGYTWRSDTSSFWPGHLDFFLYTDSVLEIGNHFILFTPEMSARNLVAYGLMGDDSLASDHLLFCADFRTVSCASGDFNGDGKVDLADYAAFPDCHGGPNTAPTPVPPTTIRDCLSPFDFDADNDVDLPDFARFEVAFAARGVSDS